MGDVLEGAAQLLDGHVLLGGRVIGCAHDSLRPGPDGLEVLISLEYGEPRVTHLEGNEKINSSVNLHLIGTLRLFTIPSNQVT